MIRRADWLTHREVLHLLETSDSELWHLVRSGTIRSERTASGERVYLAEDVERLRTPASPPAPMTWRARLFALLGMSPLRWLPRKH